jgi:hypothetical protein
MFMKVWLILLGLIASLHAELPSRDLWPERIQLKNELRIDQQLPNGKITRVFQPGAEFDLVEVTKGLASIRSGVFAAQISLADTNFAEEVEAKKRERDKIAWEKLNTEHQKAQASLAALEMEKKAKEAAGNPLVSENDEEVSLDPSIYEAIKDKLKDPDSFQPRKLVSKELMQLENKTYIWNVKVTYGAKNGFGGYSTGTAEVLFRAGKAVVIKME